MAASVPEGAASPAISAPEAPSTRIQLPNLRSRATRCGATVTITAAASATRTSGNDGASEPPVMAAPKSGQSPVAARAEVYASRVATSTAPRPSSATAGRRAITAAMTRTSAHSQSTSSRKAQTGSSQPGKLSRKVENDRSSSDGG